MCGLVGGVVVMSHTRMSLCLHGYGQASMCTGHCMVGGKHRATDTVACQIFQLPSILKA